MKMFALRGEKKKEMELPGDFFVDSMCVALARLTGLARTRSCCHRSARGWWPVLAWVGSCHCWNWEPGGAQGAPGSPEQPGQQDPALLPALGRWERPGGFGAPAQPSCASSHWSSSTGETLEEFPLV